MREVLPHHPQQHGDRAKLSNTHVLHVSQPQGGGTLKILRPKFFFCDLMSNFGQLVGGVPWRLCDLSFFFFFCDLKGLLQQLHKRPTFWTKKETVLKFVGFCAQEGQQYSETGSLQIIRVPRNDFGFFFLTQFFRPQIFHRKFENFRKCHEILPWESVWESEITMFSNILKPVSCSLIPHLEMFFDLY